LGKVTPEFLNEFEKKRLTTTALLGLFAAMPVYEAYNALIDYLFDCLERKRKFEFPQFRILSHKLLSEMRKDVGVFSDELVYRGNR
jgi:preprotein translocase subunit Sec63